MDPSECDRYAYDCTNVGATVGIVIAVIAGHFLLPPIVTMCCSLKTSSSHILLFNYVMFFPWMLTLILFQTRVVHPVPWLDLLPIVLTPFTYIVAFLDSCCSNAREHLSEFLSEDETIAYIDSLRQTQPTVTTILVCSWPTKRYFSGPWCATILNITAIISRVK